MILSHVVIINDSSQAKGGATGLAVLSAQRLRARGLRVTFVCGDSGDAPDLEGQGIEIISAGRNRLLQTNPVHAISKGIHDPNMHKFIADVVSRTDSVGTAYHVHGWAQIFSPAIFAALSGVASRTYIHAHDMFLACPNGVYMDYRRNEVCARRPLSASCVMTNCDKRSYPHKLWRVMRQKSLFRNFDQNLEWAGILAIHPGMIPRLARAGYAHSRMRVVRNPTASFTTQRVTAETNNHFVYVGRLEEDKGILDLARAARRTKVDLVCVGDGVLRERIAREFPEIHVTGWLPKSEIQDWVSTARALIMPSHHPEPFALVLAEAVSSGLPVAVAKSALMAEEIVASGVGLSFDVFNDDSFDNALRHFAKMDAETLAEMSARGWSGSARLALDQEEWTDHLVELYEEAVANVKNRGSDEDHNGV